MQHEVRKTYGLEALPIELHGRIRTALLRDPDLSLDDLKPLRLVSKTFNLIWSPAILSKIRLFPSVDKTGRDGGVFENLRHLVVHHARAGNLAAVQTITISTWHCLSVEPGRCSQQTEYAEFEHHRESIGQKLAKLASVTITPSMRLVKSLAVPGLSEARNNAALLPKKVKMPNVRCVRLTVHHCESNWVLHHTAKFLFALPALTELHLSLSTHADMAYLTDCLAGLSTLQILDLATYGTSKCLLQTSGAPPSSLDSFSAVLNHNRNLTHLSLALQNYTCYLSRLLHDIPAEHPLKLQHLSFGAQFVLSEDVLPHIRSLQSFDCGKSSESKLWCKLFAKSGIFPPSIQAFAIDDEIITFLEQHPGVVSLAFCHVRTSTNDYCPLFTTLSLHSGTLRSLSIRSHLLANALKMPENVTNFLRCICLKELILHPCVSNCPWRNWGFPFTQTLYDERQILPTIARLNRSLTLVIANNRYAFRKAIAYCRQSEDVLLRDLAGRLVYEDRTDFS